MKKTISVIICFLITLFIGVPVMNSASKYMRAAEVYEGEKVVDIEFPAVDSAYNEVSGSRFYAVTENKNLFYRGDTDGSYGSPQWSLARDVNGKVLENVKYVSSIQYSECSDEYMALREDDQFYIAGTSDGKFGDGDNSGIKYADAKLINPSIANIKAVELGYRVSFLLTNDGSLYASGDNEHGQFGNGTTTSSSTFIRLPIDNVKKIVFVYPNTVYALKNDGTVWGWGGYVYDGRTEMNEVTEPVQIYNSLSDINGFFENAVDIIGGISQNDIPILGITTIEEDNVILYAIGEKYRGGITVHYSGFKNGVNPNNVSSPTFFVSKSTKATLITGILIDGLEYQGEISDIKSELKNVTFESYDGTDETKAVKMLYKRQIPYILNHKGEIWNGRYKEDIKLPLVVTGFKQDSTQYKSSEKYNDSVTLNIISTSQSPATCEVENPLGSTATVCTDFKSNSIDIDVKENERVYRKYIIANEITNEEFIVDLYKAKPKLQKYSITSSNKIKSTDIIDLSVPTEQSNWNKYTATITDSFGNTKDYNGETLDVGRYTFLVKDSYGNTQDYQFEVTDNPEPTAVFTPSSIDLVYKDSYTKVNGIIGNFSLQYPVGEPTSTIASIQLGTSGDESHFSIDTTGTLKVKGSDLDAGTYNITVSGKDANQMDFTKTVQIVVGKANQDNYQITNNANYNFLSNQEIAITTSGNESGENETYSIINGHTVAQISNTNKFKMLSAGTFTLEATVAGNNNYNSKTVTKQITLSQLPTQTNPIKISSGDSMMYGNTYTPTSTGGTGSGNVTWTIENDSGTGASLNNGSIRVTGVGTFTLKVTKAADTNYQSSSDSKVITVKQRKTVVKPKDVTRKVGEAFKDNGVTYNPQPIAGDNLGTPIITSKYPLTQQAGRYTDGIQVTGLTNPNYDFEYQEGTLVINDTTLPNNGSGYYKIEGTKGKNNWYVSDIKISTLNKDGYDLISSDGITFGTTPLIYQTDGDYPITFYLKNSTTGIIAKGINYQVKIDQTPPTVPTLTMNQLNTSRMARLINFLSFGNWMNTGAEVIMSSTDGTSGIDNYSYVETDTKGTSNTKTSTTGKVTYQDDVEIGITAKACDKAGNCSDLSASETLMIDRKGPDITGVKDQSVYKYYYLPRFVKVKDSGSGLSYAEYKKDGTQAGTIQEDVNERIDGVGKYEVYAIDNAGNESTLSFEIVPLPDIEDIDGSDESKD
ncbi:MAG: hypothetical protein HFF02_02510, partial [Erysipelotrichaceae bacterium]|nr:hypothetical protein [Erysipelotrichaceae bacterium]